MVRLRTPAYAPEQDVADRPPLMRGPSRASSLAATLVDTDVSVMLPAASPAPTAMYLAMPIDIEEFVRTIDELLGAGGGHG